MPMHGKMMHAFDRSIEHRIDDLHARLKITPAEEEQWGKVAEVMRANAAAMEALAKETSTGAGAVDQLRRYETMAQAHLDGLKKFISTFATLYDSLSPEQRTTADSLFRGRMGPPEGARG